MCITGQNAHSFLVFILHQINNPCNPIPAQFEQITKRWYRNGTFAMLLYIFPIHKAQGNSPSIGLSMTIVSTDGFDEIDF